MAQCILTRFIPCTASKGSRIKAEWSVGGFSKQSVTIPYPHELSSGEGHLKAACMLLKANNRYNDEQSLFDYYAEAGYKLIQSETEKGYVFSIDYCHNIIDLAKVEF